MQVPVFSNTDHHGNMVAFTFHQLRGWTLLPTESKQIDHHYPVLPVGVSSWKTVDLITRNLSLVGGQQTAALAPCISLLSDSIICDNLVPSATGLMALSIYLTRREGSWQGYLPVWLWSAFLLHLLPLPQGGQEGVSMDFLRFSSAGQLEAYSTIWAVLLYLSATSISTQCSLWATDSSLSFFQTSLSSESLPHYVIMERWGCKLLALGFFSRKKKYVCIFFLVTGHIETKCRYNGPEFWQWPRRAWQHFLNLSVSEWCVPSIYSWAVWLPLPIS